MNKTLKIPTIQVVFCNGFCVVSRKDDEENPVGHSRFSTWLFPFVIGWEMIKQFRQLKHKKPYEKN